MALRHRLAQAVPDRIFYPALARAFRRFEPELARLDEFVPAKRTAVDVGTWWGPWTYWLSRRVPRVVAFEPQPHVARFLRRVVAPNVMVVEAALSDHDGVLAMEAPRLRGQDALARVVSGSSRVAEAGTRTFVVRAERLDDHHLMGVGFVKIDVEGHELEVIEGGQETLVRERPVLLVEIEQRHHAEPIGVVFDRVASLGYAGSFLFDDAWRPLADFDVEAHQLGLLPDVRSRAYVNNFLFRPTS